MISTLVLIFGLFLFGKLIWFQLRVWMLARRGFHAVEHIGEDNVRRYFYLRPKDSSFEFDKGVYILQKDALTKTGSILQKVNSDLYKGKNEAEQKEIDGLLERMHKLRYNPDVVTLRWGIPTISYYGNDPNPINFKERKKLYDSKNIAALIQRIMLTKEWKLVRLVLIIAACGIILSLILGGLYWNNSVGKDGIIKDCIRQINESNNRYISLLNQTITTRTQSNVVTI